MAKLNHLQSLRKPIEQNEKEEYKLYFEYANKNYNTYKILFQYFNLLPEFVISNYGNIKINGCKIESTLVKNGPNKGYREGNNDNYKEILFPKINLGEPIFTYRLVAEVWCNNPDIENYNVVHHIGHDDYDIKNNLLFVTWKQHGLIRHNRNKR